MPSTPESHLNGRHLTSHPAHPYVAVTLLTLALIVAAVGATLGRPAFPAGAAVGEAADAGPLGIGPSGGAPPSAPATTPGARPTASVPRTTAPPVAAPGPTRTLSKIERMENEVTVLVNRERARAGCGSVRTDERLRAAARAHSADMAAHDYFSHTGRDGSSPWDRAGRAGYDQASGENIAWGYATPAAVMAGWMNSAGHRANILNCDSRATGVGLAYRGTTPYWTQMFGRV